jgi:hypothetical protein
MFDPTPGTFETATIGLPRAVFGAASVIANSRLLMLGGQISETTMTASSVSIRLDTEEVTSIASLTAPRAFGRAVVTDSNRVVVTGGRNGSSYVGTIEAMIRAQSAAGLAPTISHHAGAQAFASPGGRIVVACGAGPTSPSDTFELYASGVDEWAVGTGTLGKRSSHMTVALSDGRLLIAGGLSESTTTVATVRLIDAETGLVTSVSPMDEARSHAAAVRLSDGRIFVLGGRDAAGVSMATGEIFDPVANLWSPAAAMTSPRERHGMAILTDGRVLIVGGFRSTTSSYLNTTLIYDPVANSYTTSGPMGTSRADFAILRLPDGRVVVAGGTIGGSDVASMETFTVGTGTWAFTTDPLPGPRRQISAIVLTNGKVLLAGGSNMGAVRRDVVILDPATGLVTPFTKLNAGRRAAGIALLPGGTVIVVGGAGNVEPISSCEVIRP